MRWQDALQASIGLAFVAAWMLTLALVAWYVVDRTGLGEWVVGVVKAVVQ